MHATASMPVMPPLQPVLQQHEITQAEFARGVGLSAAAVCRLVRHGLLPARNPAAVRGMPPMPAVKENGRLPARRPIRSVPLHRAMPELIPAVSGCCSSGQGEWKRMWHQEAWQF